MFLTTNRNTNNDIGNRLNRLLNDAFGGLDWQYRDSVSASWVPPVDIFEQNDAIRIMAEVPGVRPEDVKISLEGNVLTVHGQKQQQAEEKTERVSLRAHLWRVRADVQPSGHGRRQPDFGGVRARYSDDYPSQGRAGEAAGDSGCSSEAVKTRNGAAPAAPFLWYFFRS